MKLFFLFNVLYNRDSCHAYIREMVIEGITLKHVLPYDEDG